ncbi:hypothetical protein BGW42_001224 [Actinomortierella wolfii]|nr:hypothetical protein BGW42_001224 [Actinomortierella wolfii]
MHPSLDINMTSLHRLTQLSSHLFNATAVRAVTGPASRVSSVVLTRNLTSATIPSKQKQQHPHQQSFETPSPSPSVLKSTPSSNPISPSQFNSKPEVTFKDRAFYGYALDIQTRWADNDQYGHLNNAHYYALFDTVINTYLIQEAGLRPTSDESPAIGVCAESGCKYFSSIGFPDVVEARLAVTKVSNSAVVYQVGIFKKLTVDPSVNSQASAATLQNGTKGTPTGNGMGCGGGNTAAINDKEGHGTDPRHYPSQVAGDAVASGHFCHVFVDRNTRRPVPIPEPIRTKAMALLVKQE